MSEQSVPPELVGERLDVAVSRLLGCSRTQAADYIDAGRVTVSGRTSARSTRLVADAVIGLPDAQTDAAAEAEPEPVVELPLLYVDDDVCVIDKPIGVAAHSSPGWSGPTVTGSLVAQGISVTGVGAAEREGIVHRLDVGTSGVMAVARTQLAYSSLKRQFKDRTVDKIYLALVQGHPDPSSGTIDAPIGRHSVHDFRFAVVNGGRPSITHYETVEAFAFASLLRIKLETGRTHQIRVHMAAVKHPCCGDLTYGADPSLAKRLGLQRQWLHASELEFEHPRTGERVSVQSPLPVDLQHALDVLSG